LARFSRRRGVEIDAGFVDGLIDAVTYADQFGTVKETGREEVIGFLVRVMRDSRDVVGWGEREFEKRWSLVRMNFVSTVSEIWKEEGGGGGGVGGGVVIENWYKRKKWFSKKRGGGAETGGVEEEEDESDAEVLGRWNAVDSGFKLF